MVLADEESPLSAGEFADVDTLQLDVLVVSVATHDLFDLFVTLLAFSLVVTHQTEDSLLPLERVLQMAPCVFGQGVETGEEGGPVGDLEAQQLG